MAENQDQRNEGQEETALTPQDLEVKKWYERMRMYPIPLPNPVKYMAARMAVAYGLDPFLGEMVFIPQYSKGTLVGYQPYVGIGGVRRAARRTNQYLGRLLRPCTEKEREALGIEDGQHAWHCEVWRQGYEKPFDGFGVFPQHDRDSSKAPPWRMARKRAEHAALRAAFDLELQLMDEAGIEVENAFASEDATAIIEEEAVEIPSQAMEGVPSKEIVGTPTIKQTPPPEKTPEEAIEEAQTAIEEALEEPAPAPPPSPQEQLEAWAKQHGIAAGIVANMLEHTGGSPEEALARLKAKHEKEAQ